MMCHTGPRSNWTHAKDGPRMHDGINPLTGKEQSLYFSEDHPTMLGWFKGMEQIFKEQGQKMVVESHSHLCNFYPKYHCELNFIEQYCGAAKLKFHKAGRGATIEDMKKKVLTSLDDISLQKIHWCVLFLLWSLLPYSLTASIDMLIVQHGCPCLWWGLDRCTGSMGKQEVSWSLHNSPR